MGETITRISSVKTQKLRKHINAKQKIGKGDDKQESGVHEE
jgi:hypothetical protein